MQANKIYTNLIFTVDITFLCRAEIPNPYVSYRQSKTKKHKRKTKMNSGRQRRVGHFTRNYTIGLWQ